VSLLALPSAADPTVYVVTVGANGGVVFSPNVTYADPGSIVSFQFWPTNHSVVRGEYVDSGKCGSNVECNPCIPQNLIEPEAPGFFFSKNFLTQSIPSPDNLAVSGFLL
jgi:hypothetical protein